MFNSSYGLFNIYSVIKSFDLLHKIPLSYKKYLITEVLQQNVKSQNVNFTHGYTCILQKLRYIFYYMVLKIFFLRLNIPLVILSTATFQYHLNFLYCKSESVFFSKLNKKVDWVIHFSQVNNLWTCNSFSSLLSSLII